MKRVELQAKKQRRKRYLHQAVLTALVVGGVMLIGGVPVGFRIGKGNKSRFKHQVKTALFRLAQKGLISFVQKGGNNYARLTDSGKKALALEQQKASFRLQKPKRWDKRWRVVIFDIPEYRRAIRAKLRRTMKGCGFVRLQNSVWVYPYDCEDLLSLLKADLKIGKDVLYLVVETIENDTKLKSHFNLA